MEERLDASGGPGVSARPRPRTRLGGLRSFVLSLAVLGLIIGGLWYWENRDGGFGGDSPYGVVALPLERNPTGLAPLAAIDRAGPDFLLETPDGGTLRLSDLQGSPVLLNFWASWCGPCRDEIPELVQVYEEHAGHGLVVVGVDLQEPNSTVLDFAEDFGITYPLVIDRDGDVQNVWRLAGPFGGLPSSYFLDETGVIRARVFGPMTKEMLNEQLLSILPEEAP